MKWEYRREHIEGPPSDNMAKLNAFGAEGWDIVDYKQSAVDVINYRTVERMTVLLKRQMKENQILTD